jgi:hypothetical protein
MSKLWEWLARAVNLAQLWQFIGGSVLIVISATGMTAFFLRFSSLDPVIIFAASTLILACSIWAANGIAMFVSKRHLTSSTSLPRSEAVVDPTLNFGCPEQLAGEPHLSWWHIPIWLEINGKTAVTEYERCRARLIFIEQSSYAESTVDLNVSVPASTKGASEFPLRLGDKPQKLPIAIRWERDSDPFSAGDAFITGMPFLMQYVRIKLQPGAYKFRLQIRHGTRSWDSSAYRLHVPTQDVSNGQFHLTKVGLLSD